MHEMTANEKRVSLLFEMYAGEPVVVQEIKGTYYGLGSELATLRLFAKYNGEGNGEYANPKTRTGYSPIHNSHFFALDS